MFNLKKMQPGNDHTDKKITKLRKQYDNTKGEVLKEAQKIVGLSPVTDEDLEYIFNKGISKQLFKVRVHKLPSEDFKCRRPYKKNKRFTSI